jgi:hypothetical protein
MHGKSVKRLSAAGMTYIETIETATASPAATAKPRLLMLLLSAAHALAISN